MSFILIPKNGEEIKINAWNWRPALELLRDVEITPDVAFRLAPELRRHGV